MKWDLKDLEEHLLVGSTLVEGSTLTEKEARRVLAGRTVSGHPIHEVRELVNYRRAVRWLMDQVAKASELSEDLVLHFHRLLFDGLPEAGGRFKTYPNHVYRPDGRKHHFVKPSRVRAAMQAWLKDFNGETFSSPAEGAATLYCGFENIHPFEDGNGRIGRVLIAYWLHWKWKHGWKFYLKDKTAHLNGLHAANDGDLAKLVGFLKRRVQKER